MNNLRGISLMVKLDVTAITIVVQIYNASSIIDDKLGCI
jgi:hypothetical protein